MKPRKSPQAPEPKPEPEPEPWQCEECRRLIEEMKAEGEREFEEWRRRMEALLGIPPDAS